MLKKYSNLIIISAAVLLFGAALYIFQNTEGLRSRAESPRQTASPLKLNPTTLPAGQVGKPYPEKVITVTGGAPGYSWQPNTGEAPAGLTWKVLDNKLTISGTPAKSETYTWNIAVEDSQKNTVSQKYTVTINDASGKPPTDGAGQGGSTSTDGVIDVAGFYNPTDYSDIPSFLVRIINIFLSVVGILAVLFIIYGGLRYITSGGNQTSVTAAKNTIVYAILGLVVSVLSFAIVQVLTNLLINK